MLAGGITDSYTIYC